MSDDSDIIGDLSYVAANLSTLDHETIATVIKAAIAEILDLRISVQMNSSKSE